MLYLLEMFKKNGSLFDRLGADSQQPRRRGAYEILGFFDTISITTLDSFRGIFDHNDADLSEDTPYNSYSLPMFSIKDVTNDDILKEVLECSASNQAQLKDNNIYQITILKLNPEIIKILNLKERESDLSGMEFFYEIGSEILKEIKPLFTDNVDFTVLGGLGSFDFIVIFKINKAELMNGESSTLLFDSMNNIPFFLRRHRDRLENKAYFDFSSSFIAFNQFNDFGEKGGPLCKVDIRLTMLHCRETKNTLKALLVDDLKKIEIDEPEKRVHVYEALGDDDFHIHITLPLFSLLLLYTYENTLSIHKTDSFREIHTAIIAQKPDLKYVQPEKKNFHVNVNFKLKKLKLLYNEIEHLIPYYLRNTVRHMIYTCKYLLCSDYYEITGVQMYSLLIDLLTRLSESEWSTGDINECIQYFSYMVPASMQMSSIYLENIDDVDWTSPVSKIIYAYEHFLVSLNNLMQPQSDIKRKLNLFLTIGHTPQIKSQRYLRPGQKDEKQYLLSFNLPSPSALDIAKTYAYLVHEVSHYCNMNVDRTNRNISFAKFLHKYLVNRIINVLKLDFAYEVYNKDELDDVLLKIILETLEDMGDNVASLSLYKFSHGFFASFLAKVREALSGEYDKYKHDMDAFNVFKAIQKIAENSSIRIDELATVVQESHADVFMLETCNFDWNELTDHYYSFFIEQNNTERKYEESNWIIRMVVLYSFYMLKDYTSLENGGLKFELQNGISTEQEWVVACANREIENIQSACDTMVLGKFRFLNAIYKSAEALYPVLEPVVKNLLMSALNFDISSKMQGKLDEIMFPDKSIMHSSIDVQLEFVLTHWMKEALWRLDILEQ